MTVDENEDSIHVCHKGYISLFPMLLGIVDADSDQLGHILDLIHDPEEMWTPYGLRSLSAKNEFFGTGENYWKGPIWININYLAVHSLKTVSFFSNSFFFFVPFHALFADFNSKTSVLRFIALPRQGTSPGKG